MRYKFLPVPLLPVPVCHPPRNLRRQLNRGLATLEAAVCMVVLITLLLTVAGLMDVTSTAWRLDSTASDVLHSIKFRPLTRPTFFKSLEFIDSRVRVNALQQQLRAAAEKALKDAPANPDTQVALHAFVAGISPQSGQWNGSLQQVAVFRKGDYTPPAGTFKKGEETIAAQAILTKEISRKVSLASQPLAYRTEFSTDQIRYSDKAVILVITIAQRADSGLTRLVLRTLNSKEDFRVMRVTMLRGDFA